MSRLSRRTVVRALGLQVLGTCAGAGLVRGQGAPRAPRPLSAGAVTSDWTTFLGPTHNGVSPETHLSRALPPPLLWDFPKGTGYATPAVAGDTLVFLHRERNEEVVVALHAVRGTRVWQFRYPTAFEDRYGYNNGPRSSPVIDGDRVYTMGAEGRLHCFRLESGALLWSHDLRKDYGVRQDFFGVASTPLIEGALLIVNVGAPDGPSVVAFDSRSGRKVWRAGKEWGPSYASPVPAVIHGKRRVFVFAGGESSPPTGGLISLDPASGKVDFTVPWRSRIVESVNASCPVVFDNKVFISASYRTGSVLLEVRPDFTHRVVWTLRDVGFHFSTPIYHEGHLYGFEGRNEPDAALVCINATTGQVVWREVPEWNESIGGRPQMVGPYRGSLLKVDGQFLCLGELGHLMWLDLSPKGYTERGHTWLFAARESWGLPVLSRGLLYVTQNTRDILKGDSARLRCYDLRA